MTEAAADPAPPTQVAPNRPVNRTVLVSAAVMSGDGSSGGDWRDGAGPQPSRRRRQLRIP
jgi:hypothetical protein